MALWEYTSLLGDDVPRFGTIPWRHRPRWIWNWLIHPGERREKGCHNGYCGGRKFWHGVCVTCGDITCTHGLIVDPVTLRRTMPWRCETCKRTEPEGHPQQELRKRRTLKDWEELSVPIGASAIQPDVMEEQYASRVREAIRAFQDSDAKVATVAGVGSASLQEAICVLGLQREMYAEQRSGTTVLRRIDPDPGLLPIKGRRARA